MRRGCVFTITILSAIVLLLSILFWLFKWPELKKLETSKFAYLIEDALEQYRSDQSAYPPEASVAAALYGENARKKRYLAGLESIVRDGQFTDMWKTPFKIEFPVEGSEGKAKLTSAGPDGEFGNEDDITSQLILDEVAKTGDKPDS